MKKDKYDEVINSKQTYVGIASMLSIKGACLISWSDGRGTQFDILFTITPLFDVENGRLLQGGVNVNDLFVSIMRLGSFAFTIDDTDTHYSYIMDKLNLKNEVTGEILGKLINGVKKAIYKNLI